MQDVPIDAVQVVTGAYEALVTLMWLAAGPGANVARGAPAACHGDRRSLEGVLDCACAHRMDVERDAQRRQQYWTARAYFSICNTTLGEILSEAAIRRRDVVFGKTKEVASRNLQLLDRFMADHRDVLGWIRPQGGITAFLWLVNGGQTPGRSARLPQMKGFSSRRAIAS